MSRFALLALLAALPLQAQAADLKLESADIAPGAMIAAKQVFSGFGCTGENASPALSWTGVPEGTKSLALMVHDPDAPTGSGWWHWVLLNIPPSVTSLPVNASASNQLPAGSVEVTNDFGTKHYGGPCPPEGDKAHRYQFTLFALDVDKIDIPENATAALAGFNVRQHAKASATLEGLYKR